MKEGVREKTISCCRFESDHIHLGEKAWIKPATKSMGNVQLELSSKSPELPPYDEYSNCFVLRRPYCRPLYAFPPHSA